MMLILHSPEYQLVAFLVVLSYFIGSVSFGILITKIFHIGDLRSIGSGNIGATNVLRTGNKKAASLTLILDGGKGYIAVFLTASFSDPNYIYLSALSVFAGHAFPIYHRFKGGKGVATFIGIMLAINLTSGIGVCVVWLSVSVLFRISSLSALICAVSAPILILLFDTLDHMWLSITLAILVWIFHRENIKRLISNSEPSINFKK